ncbi:MAG: hypothetical protein PHE29_05680 [Tissierellia bacterium]|nr:hypothetical protein [Tissierellia bacterium]
MKCPKCGSDKIQITNEIKSKKRRGFIWWLCIGWWLFLFIGFFTFLLRRGSKTKNITKYNCLNCGYSNSNKKSFL